MSDIGRFDEDRAGWDAEADTFDDAIDHGLTDPAVRLAWTELLTGILPSTPARVLDVGCGTGRISVLLAELGYAVTGVDFSPPMIDQARHKARRHWVEVDFAVGDAARPPAAGPFDVVLSRHVLWALADTGQAVDTWLQLLAPAGLLVLIEGFWGTGAGLRSADLLPLVQARTTSATLQQLAHEQTLWGQPMPDERYLITAQP